MIVEITNVSPFLAERLSKLAKEKGQSRNKFIIDVLTQYSVWGDKFFVSQLPEVIRFMVKDTLGERDEKFMQLSRLTADKIFELTDVLTQIVNPEGEFISDVMPTLPEK